MDVNGSSDSATERNGKEGLLDSHAPKEKGKERDSGVKTSTDPGINQVDEEALLEETDEQLSTALESTVDPSGKGSYHFVSLIPCS